MAGSSPFAVMTYFLTLNSANSVKTFRKISTESQTYDRNTWQFDYYRPQRSWAKVIFSEACVKNSVHGGRGSGPGGSPNFSGGSPNFRGGCFQFFGGSPNFRRGSPIFLGGSPNFQISPDTVNERPVRILLECILVSLTDSILVNLLLKKSKNIGTTEFKS